MESSDSAEAAGERIMEAAKRGDAAEVARLLEARPSLTGARDPDGSTPLHWAAWKGHAEVVEFLLAKGADVNARDKPTWTPLHLAAREGHAALVELLLANGAELLARSSARVGALPRDEKRFCRHCSSIIHGGNKPGFMIRGDHHGYLR